MKEHYYIDGYNFLSSYFAQKGRYRFDNDLEVAREQVLNILREFSALSGSRVTIVFDGKSFKGEKNYRTHKEKELIRVIYASPSSDADSVIESLVYRELDKERVYVVSSDLALRQVCLGMGVLVMKPENFLRYSAQLLSSIQFHQKHSIPAVRVETLLGEKIRSIYKEPWKEKSNP